MNYLLDTNIISELIKKQPNAKVVQWIDAQDPIRMYLSVITIGEIRKGIEKLPLSERKATLQTWLSSQLLVRFDGRIVPITTNVMLRWGELTGRLEMKGIVLSAVDSFLAAIALDGHFTLVTRNTDDFRETDVTLFNPWNA
ncbi:MAG: type II toxin-antitoxin system VapC family toxin [Chloroflexia bacterium]|nr:type II toxin-antitoxin system VapC family toxin [Chloroflexia bacterium]